MQISDIVKLNSYNRCSRQKRYAGTPTDDRILRVGIHSAVRPIDRLPALTDEGAESSQGLAYPDLDVLWTTDPQTPNRGNLDCFGSERYRHHRAGANDTWRDGVLTVESQIWAAFNAGCTNSIAQSFRCCIDNVCSNAILQYPNFEKRGWSIPPLNTQIQAH